MTHWTELRGEAGYLRFLEMEGRIEVTFAVRKMVGEAFHWRIRARAEWSKAAFVASMSGFPLVLLAATFEAWAWLYPMGMSLTACSSLIMVGQAIGKHRDKPHYEALEQWHREWKKRQQA